MAQCESNNFVENVIELCKEKRWKEIINGYYHETNRNKLLWVFPSEENLNFIKQHLQINNSNHVISVGCGSGLFEWILNEACRIDCTCIEVDDAWWKCKYAPPTFYNLHYANACLANDKATIDILADSKSAIMFCYFNNRPAFLDYLKYFTGNILIIIGPGEDGHTHTDPTPFEPDIGSDWQLQDFQEVRSSKDYIAIYKKMNM